MILTWQREPVLTPFQRKCRLIWLTVGLAGLILLSVWNPLEKPGPKMCGMRLLVGLPCVSCGMTRGGALCLRGHPIEASTYNPLTIPVFLLFLGLGIKWAYECLTGTFLRIIWDRRWARAFFLLLVLIVLANWAYMITYRREDTFEESLLGQLLR
jgi:hypothetical protein